MLPPPHRPSRVIARVFEADLSAPVVAAGTRLQNVRQISERVAMGRALWRELVIGFAYQLGELNLGFTQLAALYVLAEGSTTTIADLAEAIGRSPSATSRLVDGLVRRRLVERRREEDDGRQRSVWLTPRGHAILRMVDRARAEQFLAAVRPMPRGERALIAMGVAALATHAISRRGRLSAATPRAADRGQEEPKPCRWTRTASSSCSTGSSTATRTARGRRWRRSARTTTRRSTTRSAAWGIRRLFRCKTCEEELTISPGSEGSPPTPLTRAAARGSAAVGRDHVVEDRQPEPERVEADPLVDAVDSGRGTARRARAAAG